MSTIKLIVSDLDGTLLSPDHRLAGSVLSAIRRYVRQGGYFTIATGRPMLTAHHIIKQVGIDLPVILCNGAVMAMNDRVVESHGLAAGDLAEMLLEAHEAGVNVLLFRGDSIEVFGRTPDIERFEYKEAISCKLVSLKEDGWRTGGLEKVLWLGDIAQSLGLWKRWEARMSGKVKAVQSESDYLELVSAQVSKGTALLKLAQMLNIHPGEVMAIGNQMNDIPMLQAAGIGVAVANSPFELKERADYVTLASYGEGVAEAIELFGYGEQPFLRASLE